MTVVAPLTALCAAALPLLAGVALGDRPGVLAWAGVVSALIAVMLVSGVREERGSAAPLRGGTPGAVW